tara:strand:- start:174 stop:524 length:351 start_codon:yes stop_codon:yes gene_type:complete
LKKFFGLLILLITIFVKPVNLNSAEILQINDSKTIIIGEQNRNLSINLVCSNVNLENESAALKLLRIRFPRGTKVKIKPLGFKDNNLVAKIYKLNENIEMNHLLYTNNLSDQACDK